MRNILPILFASLLPLTAGAQTLKPQAVDAQGLTVVTYVCEVILVAPRIPASEGVWKFQTDVKAAGSHGGEARLFAYGAHEIQVIADGTWLGLAWFHNEQKIAQGVFVMGPMDRALHRVGILYDPADEDAQVSVGCTEGEL